MAIIIKLREKLGAVLLIVIGFAIVGFLFMDINLTGGGQGDTVVGRVNSQDITIQSFESRVQESIENYRMNTQSTNLDEQTIQYLRQQTWEQYIEELLLKDQYDNLAINVTSQELLEMIRGDNPHPAVRQAFTNPETGAYDPSQVMLVLRNLDQDQTGETRQRWVSFEQFIKKDRFKTKYTNLVKKGIYHPTWLAEQESREQNKNIDLSYVMLNYNTVPDTDVTVSDSELRDFVKRHTQRYHQEESVTIDYIEFLVTPSARDTASALQYVEENLANFSTTENDSIFIKLYSDTPYDGLYHLRDEMEGERADEFFTEPVGSIVGPYLEEGEFRAVKIVDRKMISDSVRASHILLSVQTNEEVQSKRLLADSLKNLLDDGADFATLAREYSQDSETAPQGGSLGWVARGTMFETLNRRLFYSGETGNVYVEPSDQGFHIVRIDETRPTQEGVKLGILTRQILPASETERRIFIQASEFAGKNRSREAFEEAAKTKTKRTAANIRKNDSNIMGLGTAREVVKWAYNAKVGDVSEVFYTEDRYIVAVLTDKKDEGTMPVESIRQELEAEVRKDKKAKILADRLRQARSKHNTLEAVATEVGSSVQSATGLNFNNTFIQGAGAEPRVVSAALAVEQNAISQPITGSHGVYVLRVDRTDDTEVAQNVSTLQQQRRASLESRVDLSLVEALKKSAKVEDRRYRFY